MIDENELSSRDQRMNRWTCTLDTHDHWYFLLAVYGPNRSSPFLLPPDRFCECKQDYSQTSRNPLEDAVACTLITLQWLGTESDPWSTSSTIQRESGCFISNGHRKTFPTFRHFFWFSWRCNFFKYVSNESLIGNNRAKFVYKRFFIIYKTPEFWCLETEIWAILRGKNILKNLL